MQLKTESWAAPLVLNRGHSFVSACTGSVLFTESELNKLHTSLAHPSAEKLLDLLKRAYPSEVSADTPVALKKIGKSCWICTIYGPPPRRVRSSVPEDTVFNHHLVMDIFYLGGDPCLHIICKGTRYNATSFLTSKHEENVRQTFLHIWILVYLGCPCILTVDQGAEVCASVFRSHCKSMAIHFIVAPVESHSTLGIVERFQAPIRRVYQKISVGIDGKAPKELRLALSTKAVNDTIGIHGLVPTMLVYGSLPSIVFGDSCSHQSQKSACE
jgi:hypothetical protein